MSNKRIRKKKWKTYLRKSQELSLRLFRQKQPLIEDLKRHVALRRVHEEAGLVEPHPKGQARYISLGTEWKKK